MGTLKTAQEAVLGNSRPQFPLVLGRDFSGIVIDAGPAAISKFKPGMEVIGVSLPSRMGSHQESVIVDSNCLAEKPASVDHSTAAGVPYAGLTAWAALFTTGGMSLNNSAGMRVLVLG